MLVAIWLVGVATLWLIVTLYEIASTAREWVENQVRKWSRKHRWEVEDVSHFFINGMCLTDIILSVGILVWSSASHTWRWWSWVASIEITFYIVSIVYRLFATLYGFLKSKYTRDGQSTI